MDSQWRSQSQSNKQGSGGLLSAEGQGYDLSSAEDQLHQMLQAEYERRLRVGVAKEQARKDLPLSTYTEAYWKIDLHNLMHFLSLRMDAHAQLEIRSYADIIGNQILACWMPMTWRAFYDYRLTARSFSGPEMELIRGLLVKGNPFESGDEDRILRKALLNQRERQEFLTKIGTS